MLNDREGNWIENKNQLKEMVIVYFENPLGEASNVEWNALIPNLFLLLSDDDRAGVQATISNVKIKDALFDIGPWTAPSPDGYPAGFFQNC